MNLLNYKDINNIELRLEEVMKKEFPNLNTYVCIDSAEILYLEWEEGELPTTTLKIRYGISNKKEVRWQRETELYLIDDSPDFIAGQFAQVLFNEDNKNG